jgi:hypothetical protein
MSLVAKESATRPFDGVWQELERRHAWRIQVVENDNPAPAVSLLPFCWSDYDNRQAAAFRERFRLPEVVAGARDDWEALLRLRHWTFVNMVNDTEASLPFVQPLSALDPCALVIASQAGGTFWCSYFSMVLVAAATSMGLATRKLSIDCEHTSDEAGCHHGVVDAWVNRFRKWVMLDPNYDHHYELDGVPLNTEEICRRWQTHRGAGIQAVMGPNCRPIARGRRGKPGEPEACACFWHAIECRNDIFRRDGRGSLYSAVLPVDEARKRQRWYQGKPPKTFEKPQYSDGSWFVTEETAAAYPDLDAAWMTLRTPHKMPYYCRVAFATPCAPFFSHYEVRVDGGQPERVDGLEFPWRLHPGACTIEARTVGVAGWRGAPYRLTVEIADAAGESPQWP